MHQRQRTLHLPEALAEHADFLSNYYLLAPS